MLFHLDDEITGSSTDDLLLGGKGADTLDGGLGNDRLIGGDGGDTYVFDRGYGEDVVYDNQMGAEPGEVSGAIEFQVVSAGPDGNLRLAGRCLVGRPRVSEPALRAQIMSDLRAALRRAALPAAECAGRRTRVLHWPG